MKTYETLTYVNGNNQQVTFGVNSKYFVNVSKDVTGLADLDNTIYSSTTMGKDGETLTSSRLEPREIEIEGFINSTDKDTYTSLRRALLKILNPQLDGTLYYTCGTFERKITAKIDGSPQFTHKDVVEEFSITFLCLDPYWQETSGELAVIASWIGEFEFPCEIDIDDGMEFGYRTNSLIVTVSNDGDVETGMQIKFYAQGALTGPMLLNVDTYEYIKLNIDMEAGDTIVIDTSYGSKSATLTRNGVESNVYRYVDVDSTFLQMGIGDNTFRYDADDGLDNLECTISYSPKYLGV